MPGVHARALTRPQPWATHLHMIIAPDIPTPEAEQRAAFVSLAGCRDGARMLLPVMPGVGVFASVFGAAAAEKGLSLTETLAMSAFVYAGAAQMVALQLWQSVWTPATLLSVIIVTATINARMILMGAALQPWLSAAPRGFNLFNLFFFTDANWLIGTRYHAGGGRDLGVMLGAGMALWVLWVTMTLPGYIAGSLVNDPKRWGIDLVLPIFFVIMLAPLWRGPRAALPWLAAAMVALSVERLLGGYVHIVIGALAGALVGALMPDLDTPDLDTPDIDTPDIDMPDLDMPNAHDPDKKNG